MRPDIKVKGFSQNTNIVITIIMPNLGCLALQFIIWHHEQMFLMRYINFNGVLLQLTQVYARV